MPLQAEERVNHLAPDALSPPPTARKHLPLALALPLQALSIVALLVAIIVTIDSVKHPTPVPDSASAGWSSLDPPPEPTLHTAINPQKLPAAGRLYLTQLGPHTAPYKLEDSAQWLRLHYALDVQVLPPSALDPSAFDPDRKQYVAQILVHQLKRDHPALAADPAAFLLAVTDADMYAIDQTWDSTFSIRDHRRAAVISVSDLDQYVFLHNRSPSQAVASTLQARVRRLLLRDIAILYWHLPYNNNPDSLLNRFRSPYSPGRDLTDADLHPERTASGAYVYDPCITFTYTPATAAQPAALSPYSTNPSSTNPVEECSNQDDPSPDTQQERFQLRLFSGLLIDRRTDFYLPGALPIQFERSTTDQWRTPAAFGISGSHNYDQYLGTWDDMRHISISNPGNTNEPMVRSPLWLPFLPLNNWVDTGSGKMLDLRWRSGPIEHFDLTRYTGIVESYLPCAGPQLCFLNGIRTAHGDTLAFTRDPDRRLTRLTSPDSRWLSLAYASGQRIARINDSHGRQVFYTYNSLGQLTSATYPSGETVSYTYDAHQHLLTFSAAPDPQTPPRLLLTNVYTGPHLTQQVLADGRTWTYYYADDRTADAPVLTLRGPAGINLDLAVTSAGGTTILQRHQ